MAFRQGAIGGWTPSTPAWDFQMRASHDAAAPLAPARDGLERGQADLRGDECADTDVDVITEGDELADVVHNRGSLGAEH